MNSLFFKKLQLVCLFLNKIEYSDRPKELCLQLPVALGLDIFAVQPNFLAGGIALGFDSFIVSPFLKFLGMVKIFLAIIISSLSSAHSMSANSDWKRGLTSSLYDI